MELERQYISFPVWNTATHAINPKEQHFIPLAGMMAITPGSGASALTQTKIHYSSIWVITIIHASDPAGRVRSAFISAFQAARNGSNANTPIEFPSSSININIESYTITK